MKVLVSVTVSSLITIWMENSKSLYLYSLDGMFSAAYYVSVRSALIPNELTRDPEASLFIW